MKYLIAFMIFLSGCSNPNTQKVGDCLQGLIPDYYAKITKIDSQGNVYAEELMVDSPVKEHILDQDNPKFYIKKVDCSPFDLGMKIVRLDDWLFKESLRVQSLQNALKAHKIKYQEI